MKQIEIKEKEFYENNYELINAFKDFLLEINTQESYFILEKMIETNLVSTSSVKNKNNFYFAHHFSNEPINILQNLYNSYKYHYESYEELSKNNFELHKQLIKEGHNPNETAKIIRNDYVEKLHELTSKGYFDFNQTIEPSLYERCSFINKENVSLIDYAAFFGSVKCFKYLLMNGANVENTGKYAVAGGNEEIIHLCEQNHSTFEDAYEAAIEFHRNDIFKYLYENISEKIQSIPKMFEDKIFKYIYKDNIIKIKLEKLGEKCVSYFNYEIFTYLEKEGMKINENIINEAAKTGNIFLVKYFLKNNQLPENILVFASFSRNIELVTYILKQKGIDINAKNIYLFY